MRACVCACVCVRECVKECAKERAHACVKERVLAWACARLHAAKVGRVAKGRMTPMGLSNGTMLPGPGADVAWPGPSADGTAQKRAGRGRGW